MTFAPHCAATASLASPRLLLLLSLLLAAAAAAAAPAFSLDVGGPHWDYTGADLKPSTSDGCRQAYAAQIACPDTLLGLATRPDLSPGPADLDAVCRSACRDALDNYLRNVRAACQADGDAARLLSRATKPDEYADVPVETVGRVLQYTLAQACSKDGAGKYCQLSSSSMGSDASFACDDDPCAAAFFRNAHDQPGSQYHFDNHDDLLPATTWWQDQFEAGFDHLVFCGLAEPKPASTLSVATTTTATATASSFLFLSSSLVTGTGADKASAETISAAAAEASASITAVTTPAAADRSHHLFFGCVSTLVALFIMLAVLALV